MYAGHWCNVIFGLIRRDALVTTRLLADYPGQDYRCLGELSLLGKFFEIPEYLFLRRLHPNASSQNTTLAWQLDFFQPHRSRDNCYPRSQRLSDHYTTIVHSHLGVRHKVALLMHLLRLIVGSRHALVKEVLRMIKHKRERNRRYSHSS